jgi:aspartyl protease family protein
MRTFLLIVLFTGIAYVIGRQHGMQEQALLEVETPRNTGTQQEPSEVLIKQNDAALPNPSAQANQLKPEKILFYGQQSLKRSEDGHYYLDGSVNGMAVRFMVDTGASLSVISADLAKRAGLGDCQSVEFRTAMGVDRDACVAKANRLDFGQFTLHDVYIGVSKNFEGNALLGMNVLKTLNIEQSGDTLILENNP